MGPHAKLRDYNWPLVATTLGRFPLEMCDRDLCAPGSEADAMVMHRDQPDLDARGKIATRRVTLRRFIQAGGSEPHERRWLSFGWRVVWFGTVEDYRMGPAVLRKGDVG